MRLLLILKVSEEHQILPINYFFPLSCALRDLLRKIDPERAPWLREIGYSGGFEQFRLFTFSHIMLPNYRREGDRLLIYSTVVKLVFSLHLPQKAAGFLASYLKGKTIRVADSASRAVFRVDKVRILRIPSFGNTARFHTLSPICVTRRGFNNRRIYLAPDHEMFVKNLLKGLRRRYAAIHNGNARPELLEGPLDYQFKFLSEPKSRLITLRQTPEPQQAKGWLFDFELTAPPELLELGYYCGFGERNHYGFGCVEVG
ncbi:MAG: CRISPR-associated endoribonuclease Cas6 [Calditrichia bacterium]